MMILRMEVCEELASEDTQSEQHDQCQDAIDGNHNEPARTYRRRKGDVDMGSWEKNKSWENTTVLG